MQLTARDTEIIKWVTDNRGATIEQINKLFFSNYTTCSIRLKKLSDNGFLKVKVHPVMSKKVYYIKKLPSFHSLVLNDFIIKYKEYIKLVQREYKLKNYIVDGLIILNSDKLIIVEIDIWNKTSDDKLNGIIGLMKQNKIGYELWVVSKRERNKKLKEVNYLIL